uniref:N-terminal methionine N(alpha)-acetyltransferase NatE n=1 Tax=Caenorhabditis japonica TaxID=281687 RepID=A0A8R1DEW0_CAEJA
MNNNQENNDVAQNEQTENSMGTEHVLSKGAKKRAKKQAKKASEELAQKNKLIDSRQGENKVKEEENFPEKMGSPGKTIDKTDKTPPEKHDETPNSDNRLEVKSEAVPEDLENEGKSEEQDKESKKEQLVPKIQRFDANGKPVKTIAGHSFVHLGEITPHNVLQLKKLNESVFPILYNDKFYVEARSCGHLGRLAYYNDVVVGAVCCRIDDISDEKSLYIMTLGTLAAYRQIGIGTVLIDYVLKLCKMLKEIKTVYLHVQVNNKSAVRFYEKHGFTNDGIIEEYYRIEPRDAYLLLKRIRY